jgi:hypothetical protein
MSNHRPETPSASRPSPAEYFLEADAGAGLLPWEFVTDGMIAARNYWIGTVASDQRPHCMPVWAVWLDGALWFCTSGTSRKARNLIANPAVVAHLESADRVVIIEGMAQVVTESDPLRRFIDAYNSKYEWNFDLDEVAKQRVFRVVPQKAFGWLGSDHTAFSGSATRWSFSR